LTVVASISNPNNVNGTFPLFIINDQPLPVYDVSLQIISKDLVADAWKRAQSGHDASAEIFDAMTPKPILVGTVPALNALSTRLDVALPIGRYQIQIQTRRGLFVEALALRLENGKVRECHDVMKAGS